MRILALVPGGIGDQILFFPTLDDLKATYPDAQIDVVVEPIAKAAYRISKSVNDTILFDFKGRNSLSDWSNLLGVMRDREYDMALSFSQRRGIGFLIWLSGIPIRVGYGSEKDRPFFTHTIALDADQYAGTMYHDLLQGLNIDRPLSEVAVSVPAKDLEWADAERKRLGLQDGRYVLIYPGTSEEAYPAENWRKVVQGFQQKHVDLPIVVLKDQEAAAIASELVALCSGVKVTAPENIGQSVSMIAGASLMLCVDSASLYSAIAAQTFTLALFGATDPEKRLPKSDQLSSIKSPTGKMADISPQMVLDRILGG
ncbi:MAG TPA: glycosyltransferase family 9 protein [Leptolyngbya sp.]|jgi:ADP-heptose:LPS heptosyltransferase|nr:glycosyltransferase family 9 protein [Leptolyngbya sp.]